MRLRIGLLLLLLAALVGCKDEDNGGPVYVTVEVLDAPTALPANVNAWHTFRLRIADMQHQPDSMICRVRKPDGAELPHFRLHDDGGQRRITAPVYADSVSGDIAAGNGTFTARINGQLLAAGVTGTYRFEFVPAGGGDVVWTGINAFDVSVESVEPCIISNWPDQLVFPQCFTPFDLEVRVARSAMDQVEAVWVELVQGQSGQVLGTSELTPAAGDTVWRMLLTPRAFRCFQQHFAPLAGRFNYFARTRFGDTCSTHSLNFEYNNMVPGLSNSTLPDTIFRPVIPGDTDTVTVTVELDDCELTGATDYYGMRFDVRRADLPDWPPPGNDFYLRDDGVQPDAVAGDGRYTVGLTFSHDTLRVNNLYYFRFYALEGFAPCPVSFGQSPYLMDSVRVIQPGGFAGGNVLDSDKLGIGVVSSGTANSRPH